MRGLLPAPRAPGTWELAASELVTNAILHTPSGDTGGESQCTSSPARDGRGLRSPTPAPGSGTHGKAYGSDDEYGRGLAIVASITDKFGHDATATGQTLWAKIHWDDDAEPGAVR